MFVNSDCGVSLGSHVKGGSFKFIMYPPELFTAVQYEYIGEYDRVVQLGLIR